LAACREVGATILAQAHDGMIRSRLRPLTKRIGTRRSLLAKLRAERLRADDHASLRREAETLAAYQASIRPGARSVDLPDVYAPDRILRIELDPSQPLPVQIEKRFKMAAKLERRRAHADRRIEEVTREIETLEGDVTAVEEAAGFAAAMGEIERIERARPSLHRGERAPHDRSRSRTAGGPEGVPFRRFELDEMWFVLVGRNNRENDELTFRTAAPSDLWFHAQHVAGSHVVLKARGSPGAPPAHIVEAAASIAAHFSKSRHSGLAPVIYTQRKYVRTFRGAKPGQVVCEREKTIVVAPRLPRTDS
jgi:predicted ribosome quality control (RQC) complex YloA/Tae2 family protein